MPVNLSQRISFFQNTKLVTAGFVAVVAVFFSWIILPFGPGITNDSLLYLECGNHLFSGTGYRVIGHGGGLAFASDRFPVYPVLLKLFSICGIQPVFFQLLLYILFAFLIIRVVFSFSPQSNQLLVPTVALLTLLFPFIMVYYNVWTEGVYLILL